MKIIKRITSLLTILLFITSCDKKDDYCLRRLSNYGSPVEICFKYSKSKREISNLVLKYYYLSSYSVDRYTSVLYRGNYFDEYLQIRNPIIFISDTVIKCNVNFDNIENVDSVKIVSYFLSKNDKKFIELGSNFTVDPKHGDITEFIENLSEIEALNIHFSKREEVLNDEIKCALRRKKYLFNDSILHLDYNNPLGKKLNCK